MVHCHPEKKRSGSPDERADLSPNNLLFGIDEDTVLPDVEKNELENPSARKELQDRCIYVSQAMPMTYGALALNDFGAARIGDTHTGDVMPDVYRASEIVMDMQWDYKIDIWAFGVMIWDLFEGGRLFRAVKDSMINDEVHLAEMVSLMGPPPKESLRRSPKCSQYWDAEGNVTFVTRQQSTLINEQETGSQRLLSQTNPSRAGNED
nr:serine/threonine-protein kinase afc3 [Quercus suber]